MYIVLHPSTVVASNRAEQEAELAASQRARQDDGSGSEGGAGEEGDEGMLPPSKPFTRTMQKQEKDALQKWVQCARCNQWRKVGAVLALGGRKVLCACPLAARWQPSYSPAIPAAQLTVWQPDTARCGEP